MAESYISELGDSLSHGVANTNGDRVKIIAPKLYNDGNGNHPSIATALSGKAASNHTHGNIANGGTLTDTAAAAAGNDYVVIRDADNAKIQTSTIKGTDVADAVSKKHSHSTLTLSTTAQAYDGSHTLALPSTDPYTSARTPTSHTHGNIANGGTLTDTAAAAAGNDYVVIRDADNAKIQTSTIKGTDVADAVSKKHSHSTLTLSTTAQAYDGTHTLALPSSDPYTSARTPSSHTHGNITNGGTITSDTTVASGDKIAIIDADNNKVARSGIAFDGSTTTTALTPKGTFETFSKLTIGTTSTTAAAGNHTHTTSIASDSSSDTVVALAHNTQYKLTAGGTSVLFKTPADNSTDTKVTQTKDDSGTTAYPLLMAGAADPNGTATTARYDSAVKLTPSTNTISANISGNAATATSATKLGTSNVGTSTKPIYLDAGVPKAGSTYAGGTAVTLNGTSASGSTASFYAPTGTGTNRRLLRSNGSGEPTWKIPAADYVFYNQTWSGSGDTHTFWAFRLKGIDSSAFNNILLSCNTYFWNDQKSSSDLIWIGWSNNGNKGLTATAGRLRIKGNDGDATPLEYYIVKNKAGTAEACTVDLYIRSASAGNAYGSFYVNVLNSGNRDLDDIIEKKGTYNVDLPEGAIKIPYSGTIGSAATAYSVHATAGKSITSSGTNGSMTILNGAMESTSGGGGSCSIDGDGISFTSGVSGSSITSGSIATSGTGTFTEGASAKGRPIDGSATFVTNSSLTWNSATAHLVVNRSVASTTTIDLKSLTSGLVYWLHVPRDNIIALKNSSALSTFHCYNDSFTTKTTTDTYNIRSNPNDSRHGGFSTAIIRSDTNFYVMMEY